MKVTIIKLNKNEYISIFLVLVFTRSTPYDFFFFFKQDPTILSVKASLHTYLQRFSTRFQCVNIYFWYSTCSLYYGYSITPGCTRQNQKGGNADFHWGVSHSVKTRSTLKNWTISVVVTNVSFPSSVACQSQLS